MNDIIFKDEAWEDYIYWQKAAVRTNPAASAKAGSVTRIIIFFIKNSIFFFIFSLPQSPTC